MKRAFYTPLMLASLVVLFLSGNQLAGQIAGPWRVDLTESGLYRLAPGSRAIIDRLDEPVEWQFYYSRSAAAQYPAIRSYARRVREFLDTYADRSGGLIRITEIDPEPYSADEDAALAAGLVAVPTETGEAIYFGLVARNSVDDRAVVPLFREDAEARLEYDLTRLLSDLQQATRPGLAVITGLPLSPDGGAPNRFVQELNSAYDLRWLDRDFEILPEVPAVLVMHPWELSDSQIYMLDQFVLAGGRAVVMVDPLAHMALRPGADGLPPINARRSSALAPLLANWGVGYDPQTVAMDRSLGLPVEIVESDGRSRRRAYPLWFSVGPERVSATDLATSSLDLGINFGSPGALRPLTQADLDITPLIATSADGAVIDADIAAGAPGPDDLLRDYHVEPEPVILGVRIGGEMGTAYPDGPPAGERVFNPADHLDRSEGPVSITIMADVDWLDDSYYIRSDPQFGESIVADNLTLALNLIDIAAGDPALIEVRSRAPSLRPMTRVEALRSEAEARYIEIQSALETEIAEAEERLSALQGSGGATALSALSSPEERAEAARLRSEIAETQARLRDIERDFRRDIDALNARLQMWTIAVPPLVVVLAGLGGLIWRRRRRTAG
ncbi:Gldg family protein [Maricaulis sp. CAU 1757]